MKVACVDHLSHKLPAERLGGVNATVRASQATPIWSFNKYTVFSLLREASLCYQHSVLERGRADWVLCRPAGHDSGDKPSAKHFADAVIEKKNWVGFVVKIPTGVAGHHMRLFFGPTLRTLDSARVSEKERGSYLARFAVASLSLSADFRLLMCQATRMRASLPS